MSTQTRIALSRDQLDAETVAASRWWTAVATGAAALVAAALVVVGASAHPGPVQLGSTSTAAGVVSSAASPLTATGTDDA
jgi:hypothetical protein